MTKPKTRKGSGVKNLADLRSRCRIDIITGCWNWGLCVSLPRGTLTPVTYIAAGILGNDKDRTMPAVRAAWQLAGNRLRPDQVVYRYECMAHLCINPAHCRAGTRTEMFKALAATGRHKGNPARAAQNLKNRKSMMIPVDRVQAAEAMFADGVMQKDVRVALGLSSSSAAAIRKGLHPHSTGRTHLVVGASVFNMARTK